MIGKETPQVLDMTDDEQDAAIQQLQQGLQPSEQTAPPEPVIALIEGTPDDPESIITEDPKPEDDPAPIQPEPDVATLKHRVNVADGMLKKQGSDLSAAQRRIAELEAERQAMLQSKTAQADGQSAGAPDPRSVLRAKLIEQCGDEQTADSILEAARLEAELAQAPLRQAVENQQAAQTQSAVERYQSALLNPETGIPDAFERSSTPEFQATMETFMPGGMELLRMHHANHDAKSVINIFKTVEKLQNLNTPPQAPDPAAQTAAALEAQKSVLSSQAQVRTRGSSGRVEVKPDSYTHSEIAKISEDILAGRYSDSDADKLTEKIRQATIGGRVTRG